MLKKLMLAAIMVLSLSSLAFSAQKPLVAAHDCTWPPMEFIDSDKQLAGYSVDYVKALAEVLGIEITSRNVAWDGIFAGLLSDRYDFVASSVTITPERQHSMDFSLPYYEVRQAVVVPKNTDPKTVDDLKGKTLGAQLGTTGFFAIDKIKGAKGRSYDEIGQAMEALYSGRIDGVVCDDPIAADFALQNPTYAAKLKIAFIIPTEEDEHYGFAVKKGNKELVDLLNKGITELKNNGTEEKLRQKWIGR